MEFSIVKKLNPRNWTITKKGLKSRFQKTLSATFIVALFAILGITYTLQNIVYFVESGEAGVRWRLFEGTEIDYVYPEGIQFIPPWDKFYIYSVRIQEVAPELFVLTKTGLRVHLFLSIRYAPQYNVLAILHQKVGPNYVNIVIIPEIEAVLREIIGTMEAEQIYTTGRSVIIEAINKAIEQVAQRYINIDDVLIRKIELPDSVAEAIRYKIKQKHLIEAKSFMVEREKKEAERMRIEGTGIRDQLNIIAASIPPGEILTWKGIQATEALAKSNNAKVVIIGSGKNGLPIILNTETPSSEKISKEQPKQ
jgi:regulator of protease activity HflC (stomatin/prohibitin superfamily)